MRFNPCLIFIKTMKRILAVWLVLLSFTLTSCESCYRKKELDIVNTIDNDSIYIKSMSSIVDSIRNAGIESSEWGKDNEGAEKYDSEYWNSVNRQEYYKSIGRKDLAKQEAKYRQDRLSGKTKGKYTNKEGEDTRIYMGSEEQSEDLKAIDEYMKLNPDF